MSGPTPLPVEKGYVNHVHAVSDEKGNVYVLAIVQPSNSKTADAQLLRRATDGTYETLHTFTGQEVGKNGYGAVAISGSSLVCILTVRQSDGSTRPVEYTIPLPTS